MLTILLSFDFITLVLVIVSESGFLIRPYNPLTGVQALSARSLNSQLRARCFRSKHRMRYSSASAGFGLLRTVYILSLQPSRDIVLLPSHTAKVFIHRQRPLTRSFRPLLHHYLRFSREGGTTGTNSKTARAPLPLLPLPRPRNLRRRSRILRLLLRPVHLQLNLLRLVILLRLCRLLLISTIS